MHPARAQEQAMEFVLSGPRIRSFSRALNCLARIGSELLIDVEAAELALRTMNPAKSSFASITFTPPFFDVFTTQDSLVSTCVLLKSVCTVFRTPASHMESLSIIIPREPSAKTQWRIDLENGVRKSYSISSSEDCEVTNSAVDRSTLPSHLVVKPKDLNKILSNFQATLGELTVLATEPGSTPLANPDANQKTVLFRSFQDPAKDPGSESNMQTQLWLDPGEELQAYHHSGPPTDVTFGLRDVRAFTAFCEGAEADIEMYFLQAGRPVLFAPRFLPSDYSHAHMAATLVLATIDSSQLGPNSISPIHLEGVFDATSGGEQRGHFRRQQHGHASGVAGSTGRRGGDADADGRDSNPTSSRLWSDLSGMNRGGTAGSGERGCGGDGEAAGPSGNASEEIHLPPPPPPPPPSSATATATATATAPTSLLSNLPALPLSASRVRQQVQFHMGHQEKQQSRHPPTELPPPSSPPSAPPRTTTTTNTWQQQQQQQYPSYMQRPSAPAATTQPSGNPNAWLHHSATEEDQNEEDEFCVPSTPEEDRRGHHK